MILILYKKNFFLQLRMMGVDFTRLYLILK